MRSSAVFAMGRSADPFWAEDHPHGAGRPRGGDALRGRPAPPARCRFPKAVPGADRAVAGTPTWRSRIRRSGLSGRSAGAQAKQALERFVEVCAESLQPAIDEALAEVALGSSESFVLFDFGSDDDEEVTDSERNDWDYAESESDESLVAFVARDVAAGQVLSPRFRVKGGHRAVTLLRPA